MKKTVVFAVHLKPLVEKASQDTVFSTRSLKNSVNSVVFNRFSPLTLQKQRKNRVCSSKGKKVLFNTMFLMFLVHCWLRLFLVEVGCVL